MDTLICKSQFAFLRESARKAKGQAQLVSIRQLRSRVFVVNVDSCILILFTHSRKFLGSCSLSLSSR